MPRAGAHALLTRPPLKPPPKERSPFDLHVLGAPPAFVLSQDQTLSFILFPNQHEPSSGDRCPMQNTAAKLSPPSLRALRHHIGKPAGSRLRALIGHPQGSRPTGPQRPSAGQGLRTLKGNDELLPEPPTTPRLTAASASGMSGKKPRVTFGCAKGQRPTFRPPPAHPFLPLHPPCQTTIRRGTRPRPSDLGAPSAGPAI
jgi:hypothetical protein